MKEALRAYTYTAAYAAFEEKEKGSIKEGKFADLVVWEQNLYTVLPEPTKIRDLKVLMTILGGKVVYQDEKAKLTPSLSPLGGEGNWGRLR
jgi:predicted amidohydrolase YtcJ